MGGKGKLQALRGRGAGVAPPAAAHSRYNGLIRRLVSFERTAECER
jgi:hypothetical protein